MKLIQQKWEILKKESHRTGKPVFVLLATKIFLVVFSTPFKLLDLLLTVLLFPVLILAVFPFRFATKKRNIFFIGLEHVINKTAERGIGYLEKGLDSYFFSYEWTGMKHTLPFTARIHRYSRSVAFDSAVYAIQLLIRRPCYVEVYFEGSPYRILAAVLLSRFFGCAVVSIERGVWYGFNEHGYFFTEAFTYATILKNSDKIFYRELGLFEVYDKYKIPRSKYYFDYNKVRVKEEPVIADKPTPRNILYLNSFKNLRRLDLFLKAIPIIHNRFPDVRFTIVGARNEEDLQFVERETTQLEIASLTEVYSWTTDPQPYYEKSWIFVLPAELVFCNFSLIEAMERGVPCVVTKVKDADRIIDHGINGLLCDMDEAGIAHACIQLLSDEEERVRVGTMAREKIKTTFNSATRLDPIVEVINEKMRW
ncbi:MAG: glycosyltransferase family 4 protein [Cytophagaceae bacterium]|jgi:glycosyltransferase involved in cell wall biosynthesis|nr:glycosyltransferase family 4 protein [Cytophagaceae bacterium]